MFSTVYQFFCSLVKTVVSVIVLFCSILFYLVTSLIILFLLLIANGLYLLIQGINEIILLFKETLKTYRKVFSIEDKDEKWE